MGAPPEPAPLHLVVEAEAVEGAPTQACTRVAPPLHGPVDACRVLNLNALTLPLGRLWLQRDNFSNSKDKG